MQQQKQQQSNHASRQQSPVPQQQHQYHPVRDVLGKALQFGIRWAGPIGLGVGWALRGNERAYNSIKDIANYGKRMTINALQAAWRTPFKNVPTNAAQENDSNTCNKCPQQTPMPAPTPDAQHPRTS